MSRLRKKQKPHVKVSSRSSRGHESRKVDRQKNTISKQQILTSGGDEEDYNLVNDVEDAGSVEEDVRIMPCYYYCRSYCCTAGTVQGRL